MIKRIIFGSMFLGLLSVFGFCQEQNQPLDNSSPLTLTIKSDKEVYEVGEEIKIEATIRNNSNKEMIVFWSDRRPAQASGGGGTSLLVQPSSMENIMYIKPKKAVKKIVIPGTLGPAFTLNYDNSGMPIDLIHNSDQEIFTGALTSNTITIKVVEKEKLLTKDEAIRLVQDYIKKNNISVLNINEPNQVIKSVPGSLLDETNVWYVEYAWGYVKRLPPPCHLFEVDKKTGKIRRMLLENPDQK